MINRLSLTMFWTLVAIGGGFVGFFSGAAGAQVANPLQYPMVGGSTECLNWSLMCNGGKNSSAECEKLKTACTRSSVIGTCERESKSLADAIKEAKGEIKDDKKETRDLKKEARDSEKDIADVLQEIAELQREKQEKINELRDKAEDAQSDAKAKVDELKQKLEEQQLELDKQVTEAQQQMDQAYFDIRNINLKKSELQVAVLDAQTNLDQNCHANALARAEKVRQEILEAAAQSKYTTGGFNSVMSGVGMSNKQRSRVLVEQLYKECRGDRAYTEAMKAAYRRRDLGLQDADSQIEAKSRVIEGLQKQIQKLKTDEPKRLIQRTMEAMQRVQENMNKTLDQINRNITSTEQTTAQKIANKYSEVARLQRNAQDDKEFYEFQRQESLQRKKMFEGGLTDDEDLELESLSAFNNLEMAAMATAQACCDDKTDSRCRAACARLKNGYFGSLQQCNLTPSAATKPAGGAK